MPDVYQLVHVICGISAPNVFRGKPTVRNRISISHYDFQSNPNFLKDRSRVRKAVNVAECLYLWLLEVTAIVRKYVRLYGAFSAGTEEFDDISAALPQCRTLRVRDRTQLGICSDKLQPRAKAFISNSKLNGSL